MRLAPLSYHVRADGVSGNSTITTPSGASPFKQLLRSVGGKNFDGMVSKGLCDICLIDVQRPLISGAFTCKNDVSAYA